MLTWVYKPIINDKYHFYILPCIDFENTPEFFGGNGSYIKMKSFITNTRLQLEKENIFVNEFNGIQ